MRATNLATILVSKIKINLYNMHPNSPFGVSSSHLAPLQVLAGDCLSSPVCGPQGQRMHVSEAHYIHATAMHTPSTRCKGLENSPLQVSELQLETEGSQLAGEWPSEGKCIYHCYMQIDQLGITENSGSTGVSIKHNYECMH